MTHLTLGHLTLGVPPLETIDAAAAAGFGSVSLRLAGRRKADDHPQIIGNPAALAAIRRRLDETGLRLSSVTPHTFSDETTSDDIARLTDAVMELRPGVVVANVYLPDAAFLDLVAPMAGAVADAQVAIGIEFLRFSACTTLGQTLGVIAQAGWPNLKVVVDALHLDRSGGSAADVAAVPAGLIGFAQLCDAPARDPAATDEMLKAESRSARLEPGEGALDLHGFLDALPPGTEIEYEVTHARYRSMAAADRARHARDRFRSFLDAHAAARGFAYAW